MQYEAFNIVIYQGIIFCAGIFGLIYTQKVLFLLLVLMGGSLFSFIYFLIIVKRKAHLYLTGVYTWDNFKFLMKIAIPFAITGIFVKLSGTIDTQMLKYMLENGNHYVGLYTLAFKLTFALTVLSGAFASSYFPSISYYIKHDILKAKDIFEKGMAYMSLLSLPIMVGVLILGDKIILTVWDERYFDSILPLKIYIASLLFIFLNYPVGNFLNAANRQLLNTVNTGITLFINIALNYILIPKYNIVGAGIAAFASNTILVLLGLPWVYKILKFSWKNIFYKFFKLCVASIGMGISIYFLQDYLIEFGSKWQLLASILIGVLSYFLLLIITKGITKEELISLRQAFKK
jgi:O-antigen/teichoic acid export membrane protein